MTGDCQVNSYRSCHADASIRNSARRSSEMGRASPRRVSLAFAPAELDAGHELFLHDHEENDERNDVHHGGGHNQFGLLAVLAGKTEQTDRSEEHTSELQ